MLCYPVSGMSNSKYRTGRILNLKCQEAVFRPQFKKVQYFYWFKNTLYGKIFVKYLKTIHISAYYNHFMLEC